MANVLGRTSSLFGSEKLTCHDVMYVHIVDLILQKSCVVYCLANPHSSEPHEGFHSHVDLFLTRLIILWYVGKLSSLKLQQHRTKNDKVIVDGHVHR